MSGAPGLTIGLTEQNANLLFSRRARPRLPAGFARWRDRLTALHPTYIRLLVDWAALAPRRDRPPAWSARDGGCMRATPPCAAYLGMRDRLRAIASQQRAQGGFEPVVVIYGTPDWAAQRPHGCEKRGTSSWSRAPTVAAMPAYRALIRSLYRLARREGVEIRYWSPWNEPDSATFLSPQRKTCDPNAPSVAAGRYARIARHAKLALDAIPGEQHLVLGELLGNAAPAPRATGAGEFARALPRDLVCASTVFGYHEYVRDIDLARAERSGPAPDSEGGLVGDASDAVLEREVLPALDAHGCGAPLPVWITETGVGGSHRPGSGVRNTTVAGLRRGCRGLQAALTRWWASPRIQGAFQYSFREDDLFRYGLVDTALRRLFLPYKVWWAWGQRASPTDPPPPLPASCR